MADLYLDCLMFRALPFAGGILDQPEGVLVRLRLLGAEHERIRAVEAERALARVKADRDLERKMGRA